ncbi:MAG: aspartate kinase [Deltaproteobacteria bacterium]|nr:aspartate kinase [Deltaproteobacteria bacterium]
MGVVVQKYGGSSVADVSRLKRVAEGVVARKRAGDRVVVVVSAMGKTTDGLIEMARQVTAEPPRRELDMLVTTGERISMALLSMAIHAAGEDAISFTGSQSGIITDDHHQAARIMEVRPHRIEEELERGRIVIVACYQGVSRQREVTTLGRGGSDTTAVALAAALNADACEIYSDVDGVYTADPNLCPQARLLPLIHHDLMQSMASAGARVLNAEAVDFARRAGIEIRARKSGDASGRETRVSALAPSPSGVMAVVGAAAVTRLSGPLPALDPVIAELTAVGGRLMCVQAGATADLLVDRTGIPGKDAEPLRRLAERQGVSAHEMSAVTLAGGGLLQRPELWGTALRLLKGLDSAAQGVWGDDRAVTFAVDSAACDRAVKALHAALIAP